MPSPHASPPFLRRAAPGGAIVLAMVSALGLPLAGSAAASDPHHPLTATPAAALDDTARIRRWREDLHFVIDRILADHPRPFAFSSRASFDSAALAIESRISELDDPRLAIETMRMVALLGDGHTLLVGTMPSTGFVGYCPIWLVPFEDGLYVAAAGPELARHLGARVVRVGELPADQALERVLTIVSGDNRYTRLDRAPIFMMSPVVMHALGVSSIADRLTLELEKGRKRETVTVAGGPTPEGFPQAFIEADPRFPVDWRTARAGGREPPRCDRQPDEAWWSEILSKERVLYLRLRRIDPVSGPRLFGRFLKKTFALADSARPEAMVIDLRHDHGGDNTILDPLIHGVVARPWLDRDGGLFVLTDRGTFSAAMNAAVFLETHTHAVFAGEPTGGRVNHYGDAETSMTPNYGMLLAVSHWPWSARLPWDPRPWIAPQLPVPSTFADWRDRNDPVVDAALDAVRNGTFQERVLDAARSGGAETAAAAARDWLGNHANPWGRGDEPDFDALTARLLDDEAWREAVAVADARTRLHPLSSQAWRRLGEAGLGAGDREQAVTSLRRALEINPESRIARAILERLGEKP